MEEDLQALPLFRGLTGEQLKERGMALSLDVEPDPDAFLYRVVAVIREEFWGRRDVIGSEIVQACKERGIFPVGGKNPQNRWGATFSAIQRKYPGLLSPNDLPPRKSASPRNHAHCYRSYRVGFHE